MKGIYHGKMKRVMLAWCRVIQNFLCREVNRIHLKDRITPSTFIFQLIVGRPIKYENFCSNFETGLLFKLWNSIRFYERVGDRLRVNVLDDAETSKKTKWRRLTWWMVNAASFVGVMNWCPTILEDTNYLDKYLY